MIKLKINRLSPQGYCYGVVNALKIVDEAILKAKKPLYILGMIIHNKHIIKYYQEQGIITLDGTSRLAMLDQINEGTIIITAHGASYKVYEKAKSKGLTIIDATCKNVLLVHQLVKKMLDERYHIIYIGQKNHPETEGILGIDKNITLITSISDVMDLKISTSKIFLTNQTTLSKFDNAEIINAVLHKYPETIIDDKICNATTLRQQAVINMPNADLCLVVGDKKSSNTNHLLEIALKKIPSFLVEGINDLENIDFTNIESINITSGASTPKSITNNIIAYLEKK